MDPLVGSAVVADTASGGVSDCSDNADLLDFCFLCSRQFFHDNLDTYGTETYKDEEILESFFEELGPVDRSLLCCCPACKELCKTLIRTQQALSILIDEIFNLLIQSRKVSYLVSKSRVVSRLFQSSNASLPPCETSSSFLQPPLSHINFPKDVPTNVNNNSNTSFPSQFDLRLDSSNFSDSLDLHLTTTAPTPTPSSSRRCSPVKNKTKKVDTADKDNCGPLPPPGCSSNSAFSSLYNDSIMNSVSDNACDISEEVILEGVKLGVLNMYRDNACDGPVVKVQKKSDGTQSLSDHFREQNESITIKMPEVSGAKNEEQCIEKQQSEFTDIGQSAKTEQSTKNETSSTKVALKEQPEPVAVPNPTPKRRSRSKSSTTKNGKETKYKCGECNLFFKNASNLKIHFASSIHKNERKYICELCGASYRQKSALNSHIAIHKGEPKFKCSICSKIFTQKSGLERHLPLHTGKHQYQCDACGKQFLHRSSFVAHKKIHEGTKEYECPECLAKFSDNSHLRRHQKTHKGEKSHTCEFCHRSFIERYNLQVHLKIHAENRVLFQCPKCPSKYTKKFKLKQHLNNIHGSSL